MRGRDVLRQERGGGWVVLSPRLPGVGGALSLVAESDPMCKQVDSMLSLFVWAGNVRKTHHLLLWF